jgi:hypothetical protein
MPCWSKDEKIFDQICAVCVTRKVLGEVGKECDVWEPGN